MFFSLTSKLWMKLTEEEKRKESEDKLVLDKKNPESTRMLFK